MQKGYGKKAALKHKKKNYTLPMYKIWRKVIRAVLVRGVEEVKNVAAHLSLCGQCGDALTESFSDPIMDVYFRLQAF